MKLMFQHMSTLRSGLLPAGARNLGDPGACRYREESDLTPGIRFVQASQYHEMPRDG
ncbi:MAG: hypothetical protein ACO3KY_03120 [Lysobacterales bacterium]